MKVFLAGGTGVVGTRALPALVAAGHDVTAVARGPAKADLVERLGGTPVTVDLFDAPAVVAAVAGHDAVVNLATHIPSVSRSARRSAWAVNDRLRREASGHLVDAALAAGAGRYVQESICFPYVDAGDGWVDEGSPIDHAPWAFAGAAVAEGEAARFTSSSPSGAGVVLRFAQFYAPDSDHTIAMSRLVRRRVSPFVGASGSFMSWVHAVDAGSAVAAALEAPAGTYNVVDDEPVRRVDADRIVAARLGVRSPFRPAASLARLSPSARGLARSLRVSHARLTEATGWTPSVPSIRDGWPQEVPS